MIALSSFDELNKIIRKNLIEQTQLKSKDVLNALTVYGTNMNQNTSNKIFESYNPTDSFIIFELKSRTSSSNVSFTEPTNTSTISYTKAYEMLVIVYGDYSQDVGNNIAARFRTENVREKLFEQGVNLEEVQEPTSFNEFVNDTMWFRTDVSINITCKFSINKITDDSEFEMLSNLEIINEGE